MKKRSETMICKFIDVFKQYDLRCAGWKEKIIDGAKGCFTVVQYLNSKMGDGKDI